MTSPFNRISSLLFFSFITLFCFSQNGQQSKTIPNSFVIHGKLSEDQLSFYTKSIEAADFEQFRKKDETITLKFKNGFDLELISAKDLMVKNKMQSIDFNKYSDLNTPAGYKYPVFEIHGSGFITAEVQNNLK